VAGGSREHGGRAAAVPQDAGGPAACGGRRLRRRTGRSPGGGGARRGDPGSAGGLPRGQARADGPVRRHAQPTGLAAADQALASVVQLLEWCATLVSDALDGHLDLSRAAQVDRDLLGADVGLLRDVATLLTGQDAQPDLEGLERACAASAAHQRDHSGDPDRLGLCTKHAFHAQAIAVAARALTADTLIATRRASPEVIAAQRCAWSGAPFWPRGAAVIVGDDLGDAYRDGGAYLTQAVDWALGLRGRVPEAAGPARPPAAAGVRLDEAVRAYLAEQGSKRLAKEDLWLLVMSTMRLRLTAYSLASLRHRGGSSHPGAPGHVDGVRAGLRRLAGELDDFYDRIAAQVGSPRTAPRRPPRSRPSSDHSRAALRLSPRA
jgi:hypothetical protein